MNDYLKSASNRFEEKFKKEFLINPISKIDAEIIVELGQILKKLNATDVKAILDEYKFKKDSEVRDDLLQWNIDHKYGSNKTKPNEDDVEITDENSFPPLIKIGDFYMRGYHLHNFDLFEEFNEEYEEYVFGIILNPVPVAADLKKIPLYCNEKIMFTTEEDRNKVLTNIIQFLNESGVGFIDLNGDE